MTASRPRAERGAFATGIAHYGHSRLGAPLVWFPAPVPSRESGLILAGTHGDESAAVVTLSCALRTLEPDLRHHHVVLAVNPDGCQLGLRPTPRGSISTATFPPPTGEPGRRSIVGTAPPAPGTWC
ncbi:putative carboxypeptidase [Pseudescherichia vulneris]|nr:putative carboxypeptidase [Pseudescherichia vulneris]